MSRFFSKRNMVIIGVIIAVFLLWYFFFSGGAPVATDILQSTSAQSSGNDALLNDLNQIKSLSLNPAIFSNPAFKSLTDSSVSLPSEPTGRTNPFGPLPNFTPAPVPLSVVSSK